MKIALVQGGGPQGTHASDDRRALVFERHLAAYRRREDARRSRGVAREHGARRGAGVATRPKARTSPTLARSLGAHPHRRRDRGRGRAPLPQLADRVGCHGSRDRPVREGASGPVRRVDAVPWAPQGDRRAPTSVPRDAIAGHRTTRCSTPPTGRLGVVISWEVFFGGRARDAIGHGGRGPAEPDERRVVHGDVAADAADRVVAAARARDRPVGGAGRTDRVQRLHRRSRARESSAPGSASRRCCRWTCASARATRSTCASETDPSSLSRCC